MNSLRHAQKRQFIFAIDPRELGYWFNCLRQTLSKFGNEHEGWSHPLLDLPVLQTAFYEGARTGLLVEPWDFHRAQN